MQVEIEKFKTFVQDFYDLELTKQQIEFARHILNNKTICVSIYRRAGLHTVQQMLQEMEKQCANRN